MSQKDPVLEVLERAIREDRAEIMEQRRLAASFAVSCARLAAALGVVLAEYANPAPGADPYALLPPDVAALLHSGVSSDAAETFRRAFRHRRNYDTLGGELATIEELSYTAANSRKFNDEEE